MLLFIGYRVRGVPFLRQSGLTSRIVITLKSGPSELERVTSRVCTGMLASHFRQQILGERFRLKTSGFPAAGGSFPVIQIARPGPTRRRWELTSAGHAAALRRQEGVIKFIVAGPFLMNRNASPGTFRMRTKTFSNSVAECGRLVFTQERR